HSFIFLCFFFSSRRRHTRCYRDWSSDVCSSDLSMSPAVDRAGRVVIAKCASTPRDPSEGLMEGLGLLASELGLDLPDLLARTERSEERRVGKECSSGGSGDCHRRRE